MTGLRTILLLSRMPWREAMAERMVLMFCIGLSGAAGLGWLVGELVGMEATAFQCALLAPLLRLYILGATALFTISHIHREWQRKGHELILALPLPSHCYYLCRFTGYALLAFGLLILVSLTLSPFATSLALLAWSFSLYCELLIVIAFSLAVAFTCRGMTTAFGATVAIWVLARNLEAIQHISRDPLLGNGPLSHPLFAWFISAIDWLLPDLHDFSRTQWLVYTPPEIGPLLQLLAETSSYLLLLIVVGLSALSHRIFR